MGFLKRLFGGGQPRRTPDEGLYFYVRLYNVPGKPREDDEIVEIRINKMNDISRDDEGNLFVRKDVAGKRKFRRGELLLYFDEKRNVRDHEVSGGELVSPEAYEEYLRSIGELPEEEEA
jgi:hypothetical protein